MIDITKVHDCKVNKIDFGDAPDFSDAYISEAWITMETGGVRELTEDELAWLNEEREFVYDEVMKVIY